MKRFKIRGTAQGTGATVKPLIIEAATEREAVEEALASGVQVTSVMELSDHEQSDLPAGSVMRARTTNGTATRAAASAPVRHRNGPSAELLAAVAPKPIACRVCGDRNLAIRKIPRLGVGVAVLGYLVVFVAVALGGFAAWQWWQEFAASQASVAFDAWGAITVVCVTWLIGGFALTASRRILHCGKCRAAIDAW